MRLEGIAIKRERLVLQNLSVTFSQGKHTVIIGPNGSGKTTMIQLLSGLIKPNAGKVYMEDQQLSNIPVHELARKRAVLEQQHDAMIDRQVLDYVALGRYPHQESDATSLRQAASILENMGLKCYQEAYFTELSGGEQQMIRLARVLAQIQSTGQWLLLDEPVKGLDPAFQQQFMDRIKKLVESGMSVISVLHDIQLATWYADELILLKNGKILAKGAPSVITTEERLYQLYEVPFSKTADGHWYLS